MWWSKNKKTVAVHDGNFHPDDVFAVATLSILLDGKIGVIRTRDEGEINKADYVLDVGHIYDPAKNRFDHHQEGGAGFRNGSFGVLVCGWSRRQRRSGPCAVRATRLRKRPRTRTSRP